jgi:hypothetical protein
MTYAWYTDGVGLKDVDIFFKVLLSTIHKTKMSILFSKKKNLKNIFENGVGDFEIRSERV